VEIEREAERAYQDMSEQKKLDEEAASKPRNKWTSPKANVQSKTSSQYYPNTNVPKQTLPETDISNFKPLLRS
jgi:hypothetical protein